ncbi:ATP-binding cassette sub-family C member 4 [Halotydeus destructor]|nr:ATP-binding cassette sub-family C member 4 [Halotydeus destructor]
MDNSSRITKPSLFDGASIFSKIYFLWILPLFSAGSKRDLNIEDLYKCSKNDTATLLNARLDREWEKELKKDKPSLAKAIFRAFRWEFAKLNLIGFYEETILRVIQPLAIGIVVRYFSGDSIDDRTARIMAACVCLASMCFISSHHPFIAGSARIGMKVRVAVSTLIYRKILRLSKSAMSKTAVGQVINHLSNDVNRFDEFANYGGYFVHGPVQVFLMTFILWKYLSWSSLAGLGVLGLFMPLQLVMGKFFGSIRLTTAGRSDKRIRLMNEIISGMRVIKMYSWEDAFLKLITDMRKKEVNSIRRSCFLKATNISVFLISAKVILFASLITYILACGGELTAETVFVAMSLINVMRLTMTSLFPYAIQTGAEALVSCHRIQSYLCLEEKSPSEGASSSLTGVIEIEKLSTKWEADSPEWNLTDISLKLEPGQLLAVIGPVGAGKSTLLMALLGELPNSSGKINVSGRVVYSPQESWCFNGSIRDNILFGRPYNPDRYKEVVRAAALEKDMKLFGFGDQTLVGEKGVTLSGGQKARITLARAIYDDADIFFLDDPLSAVDTAVADHLFHRCVMEHLAGRTRILVTHQIQFIREADLVLVLKEGKNMALGTYDELVASGIDFISLLQKEDKEKDKGNVEQGFPKMGTSDKMGSRPISRSGSMVDVTVESEEISEQKQEEEIQTVGSVGIKLYIDYINAGSGMLFFVFVAAATIVSQVLYHYSDYYLTEWTNAKELNSTSSADESGYIQGYSIMIVGLLIATLVRGVTWFSTCMRSSINLHDETFQKVLRAPMSLFDNNPVGRILNRFSRDVGIIDELLPSTSFDLNLGITLGIGTLATVGVVEPITLIPAGCLLYGVFRVRNYCIKTSRDVKRCEGLTRSPIYSHVSNTILGLASIRAFNAQKKFEQEYFNLVDDHSGTWHLYICCARALGVCMDWMVMTYITLVTLILMVLPDNFQGGSAGLILASALTLLQMVPWGARQSAELEAQMTSVERVLEYRAIEPEGELESDKPPPKSWPQEGRVVYDHVSFTYEGSFKPVLVDLCFDIKPGEKIGIVGRTGAGKSSLLQSLFRMVEPEGTIFIDGLNTKSIGLRELRQKISIIPQDPVLFTGTVRRNIDPFNERSDEEIWQALEEVQLKDAIFESTGQLEAKVNESGSNFSVGQRQLICLARALVKNNRILVLDEATANVDHETDSLIQGTIRKKFADCTVLTIAHRLNTVIDSDRLIVLDAGKLAEFDEPHLLLQQPLGLFRKLVKQTGHHMSKQLFEAAQRVYESKHGPLEGLKDGKEDEEEHMI